MIALAMAAGCVRIGGLFAISGEMRFPALDAFGVASAVTGTMKEPLTAEALCGAIPGLERLDYYLHKTNLRDVVDISVGFVSGQGEEEEGHGQARFSIRHHSTIIERDAEILSVKRLAGFLVESFDKISKVVRFEHGQ
ncbi:hypothetical protein TNCV_1740151 [Trichonephila clavipes]|nr:hypothetical protein TNCV_1740151 [Trichonephila clavipes]